MFRAKDGWIIASAIGNPVFARWAKLMREDDRLPDARFVPVALILGQLAAGIDEAELRAEYDLTHDQVRAALRYAAWNLRRSVIGEKVSCRAAAGPPRDGLSLAALRP